MLYNYCSLNSTAKVLKNLQTSRYNTRKSYYFFTEKQIRYQMRQSSGVSDECAEKGKLTA